MLFKSLFALPRLAAAAWLLAIVLVLLCAALLVGSIWHPHFLPMTGLLVGMFVVGMLLMGAGTRAIFRGPHRRRAAGWMLLGLAPLLFWTALFTYGLTVGSGRLIKLNVPLKLLIPLGESIMDLEARWRYPQRTSGERVVMISAPVENASEQVAAMDEHVRQLEALLGRKIDGQVHWVRGPLLGMSGKAIVGLCMGSRLGEGIPEADGLTVLDRHEVAHCVMNRFTTALSEPLAILSEGWAEGHSGISDERLAARLWDERQRGAEMSLVELTSGDWPARHEWPVYVHGGPLTRYLIRTYGPEKFIELYATSRCSAFAADCQRILGVSLEELDKAYWQDVERFADGASVAPRRVLSQFQLGPEVDADQWQKFVAGFVEADAQRQKAVRQGTTVVEWRAESRDKAQDEASTTRYSLSIQSDRQLLQITRSGNDELFLAQPERSLQATRASGGPWQVVHGYSEHRQRDYRRQRYAIATRAFWLQVPDEFYNEQTPWSGEPSKVVVRSVKMIDEGGQNRLRIELDGPPRPETPQSKSTVSFDFSPEDFSLQSFSYQSLQSARGELTYTPLADLSLFESLTTTSRVLGSDETTYRTKVVARNFDAVPDTTFDPQAILGDDAMVVPPAETAEAQIPWHYLPLLCGGASLLAGLIILTPIRRRPEKVN